MFVAADSYAIALPLGRVTRWGLLLVCWATNSDFFFEPVLGCVTLGFSVRSSRTKLCYVGVVLDHPPFFSPR